MKFKVSNIPLLMDVHSVPLANFSFETKSDYYMLVLIPLPDNCYGVVWVRFEHTPHIIIYLFVYLSISSIIDGMLDMIGEGRK